MKSLSRITVLALAMAMGTGLVHAQDDKTQGAERAAAPQAASAAVKKGLTWGVYPADSITGTITVSCQGAPKAQPGNTDCNAYNGDTPGTEKLPVLCFNKLGFPYPVPNVPPHSTPAYWSGGVVATTPAVSPIAMGWTGKPRAVIDAYCASQFGPGWVVAEHHMGQGKGWKFGAYGNTGKPGKERFWMHITNQPNAIIWTN